MRRGRRPHPDVLTPREWEVLDLLREGLSNEEIAARLGISYNGARYHVAEILSKLGVGSREEAAAWQPGAVTRRFAGIAVAAAVLYRMTWGKAAKLAGVFVLGGAATIGVLFAAGVIMTRSDGGHSASVVAIATVGPTPDSAIGGMVGLWGAYMLHPAGTKSPAHSKEIDIGLTPAQYGAPVDDVVAARASSLFPATLPDGDSIVAATSDSKPSELYLRLTLSTPDGQVELVRQRPRTLPIDLTYDPAVYESRPFDLRLKGRYLQPKPGHEDQPLVARAFEDGVETIVSGLGLSEPSAFNIYSSLDSNAFPSTLSVARNPLPGSQAGFSHLNVAGPCDLKPAIQFQYALTTTRIRISGKLHCKGLLPLASCPPGSVYENGILLTACDTDGYVIDAGWSFPVPDGAAGSAGSAAFVQEGAIVSGFSDYQDVQATSGDKVPLKLCASVRDQQTCASFTYTVP